MFVLALQALIWYQLKNKEKMTKKRGITKTQDK